MLLEVLFLFLLPQQLLIPNQLFLFLFHLTVVGCLFPREANSVFVDIPEKAQATLRAKGWLFYVFIGKTGCRLMCSWDLAEQDVEDFATDLKEALAE